METSGFWWSEEAKRTLLERYATGPTKLAKLLGTSRMSVTMKARRLGIRPKRLTPAVKWTKRMDRRLQALYPTADGPTLVVALGLPLHCIRSRARRLGIISLTKVERQAKTRAENNTSCNIRFFHEWSPDMAYVLGFLFADGSITKRLGDVVTYITIADVAVLKYIKRVTASIRPISPVILKSDETAKRKPAACLTISSVIMVRRLMELGLHRGKTYRDDPFPQVPDEMLPHFIRGYFDGDGTAFVAKDNTCRIKLIGTPKMIKGLHNALVHIGMTPSNISIEKGQQATWARTGWSAVADIQKFHDYVYPAGFPFCLDRKRRVIADWLSSKQPR